AALAAGEFAAEARNHGDGEGEGLAGAGLAAAEHVAPVQGVGERVDLDGERRRLADLLEGGDEGGGHAERAEGDVSQSGSFVQARVWPAHSAEETGTMGEGGDGHIR